MIFAIAALLLQIPAIPQDSSSADSGATAEIARAATPDTSAKSLEHTDVADLPHSSESLPAEESAPPSEDVSPVPVSLSKFSLQDGSEKLRRREWLVLSIAQHSAATFDAWSTRRVVSSGAARETNPILRPFAGNASIYATIQVGPILFHYIGRRMMTSQHGWARHTWWILQAASTAASLASGAHNLSIH